MKNYLHSFLLTAVLSIAFVHFTSGQSGYYGNFLRHQVYDSTNANNYTIVDDPALNGDANRNILITTFAFLSLYDYQENYNTGVFYYANAKWAIYREDSQDSIMYPLSGYNLVAPTANGSAFKHTATSGNTVGNVTYIDHPSTNGKPDALVFITHNWGSSGGVYNNHLAGVFYNNGLGKWSIYNEDLSPFPDGAVYNVFVPDSGSPNAFVHTVNSTTVLPSTFINNPVTDANPQAVLIVTHSYNPGGVGGIYNTVPVGVGIKSGLYPFIYHLDDATPFDSAMSFNVLVANDISSGIPHPAAPGVSLHVFPNPSAEGWNIQYRITQATDATLKIYTTQGMLVETLLDERVVPGLYTAKAAADVLPAGTYVCVLQTAEQVIRKTATITR